MNISAYHRPLMQCFDRMVSWRYPRPVSKALWRGSYSDGTRLASDPVVTRYQQRSPNNLWPVGSLLPGWSVSSLDGKCRTRAAPLCNIFNLSSSCLIVVWPTLSSFADWSKRHHVTLSIIICSPLHGHPGWVVFVYVLFFFCFFLRLTASFY